MPPSSSKPIILAVDLGSSSTRSALFNSKGALQSKTIASENYSIRYGPDGAAELSPLLLLRAVDRCISKTLAPIGRSKVTAVSFSSFWHGLLGVDDQWRPLTPVYTWADSRSAAAARELRRQLVGFRPQARTGCRLHSSYWPAKFRWLRRSFPALFRSVAIWVSPVDWILHEIFGTVHTSPSMASGTGLYNYRRRQWDTELCRSLSIAIDKLPVIRATSVLSSSTREHLSLVRLLTIGDGAASNLGSAAIGRGRVAVNVGTSAAVRVISTGKHDKVSAGLFRYVVDKNRFVVGGATSNAGNLRQWALRELRLRKDAHANLKTFSRTAAARDSLVILPFWVDERAPTWPDDASGVIYGLNPTVTATEIMRSLTTASFYRLAQILDILRANGHASSRIIVSGGILRSPEEIRLLADSIGHDVEISRVQEASLRGAAVFALEQQGIRPPALPSGRLVKHDRALAILHAERRAKQEALENRLTKF